MDEAPKPLVEVDHDHDFVPAADKIPDTHGAPKLEGATAAEWGREPRRDLRPAKALCAAWDFVWTARSNEVVYP